MSKIEWTQQTWNPIAGCSPVSEGCRNCYAAREAIRLQENPTVQIRAKYEGTAVMRGADAHRRAVFTGRVNLAPQLLGLPLRWKRPRRVFVNSMSDLFHEKVPITFIAHVFAVMAATPRHTYQVLTKRPEWMATLLNDEYFWQQVHGFGMEQWWDVDALATIGEIGPLHPLVNVWLGTSVEDQAAADERIPHLLRTTAAVRFLSCEPLIGPVDLTGFFLIPVADRGSFDSPIDWVIAGGESGPGARPCDIDWLYTIRDACRDFQVPLFVKQLGAQPIAADLTHTRSGYALLPDSSGYALMMRSPKGGDPSEWPETLRIREYPNITAGV